LTANLLQWSRKTLLLPLSSSFVSAESPRIVVVARIRDTLSTISKSRPKLQEGVSELVPQRFCLHTRLRACAFESRFRVFVVLFSFQRTTCCQVYSKLNRHDCQ
jgi:hypothetical protein